MAGRKGGSETGARWDGGGDDRQPAQQQPAQRMAAAGEVARRPALHWRPDFIRSDFVRRELCDGYCSADSVGSAEGGCHILMYELRDLLKEDEI